MDVQPARNLLHGNPHARGRAYHQCRIYATDMNEMVLKKPRLVFSGWIAGIYPALS